MKYFPLILLCFGCAFNRPVVVRTVTTPDGKTVSEVIKTTTIAFGDAVQNIGKTGAAVTTTGAKAGLEDMNQQTDSKMLQLLIQAAFEAGKKAVVP